MKNSFPVSILFLAAFALSSVSAFADQLPSHPLIEQARREKGPQVQYAVENGAKVGLTADGKTFYVLWLPAGSDPQNPPPMIATISGHDGWAFQDFSVWHPFVKKRGYGVLSVQWWMGKGEASGDYLKPDEIYRYFDQVLREMHAKPGTVLLHGFSRGATNTYPVAALDRSQHNNYFALCIANSGKANSNYPPVREIEQGRFGETPLAGTHWVTYGGGQDPNPDRDGITGMRAAGQWIKKYGGVVELAIEDPNSGHGGFHRNPKNTEAALDVFDRLRG